MLDADAPAAGPADVLRVALQAVPWSQQWGRPTLVNVALLAHPDTLPSSFFKVPSVQNTPFGHVAMASPTQSAPFREGDPSECGFP